MSLWLFGDMEIRRQGGRDPCRAVPMAIVGGNCRLVSVGIRRLMTVETRSCVAVLLWGQGYVGLLWTKPAAPGTESGSAAHQLWFRCGSVEMWLWRHGDVTPNPQGRMLMGSGQAFRRLPSASSDKTPE